MLSEATRTAALATKSEAKPGMDAPPFGAIADHVLVAVVKRIGDAQMRLQLVGQTVGETGASQPIGAEAHYCSGKDIEIRV
jgi:hypothetical protein